MQETIAIVEPGNHEGIHQQFQAIERKVLSDTTNRSYGKAGFLAHFVHVFNERQSFILAFVFTSIEVFTNVNVS